MLVKLMIFKGKKIRLPSDFLTAMLYARRNGITFKILKERRCEPRGNVWIYI